MTKPVAYTSFETSWFHWLSLIILIATTVFLIKYFKKGTEKQIKKVILISGIIMVIFEIYKQIIFNYDGTGYEWYAFPFQFCSTPMYLYLVLGLSKNKKLDEYLIAYLATYATFAGFAVMIYPSSVFVDVIGINIQTMVHHGLIAAIGISLLVRYKLDYKAFFKGMTVFVILSGIAYAMNTVWNIIEPDIVFNMFFINPKYGTEIPVLSMIEPVVPHIVFLFVYVFGFTFVASLVFFGAKLSRMVKYKTSTKPQLAYQN